MSDLKLPELGENIDTVEVSRVIVKVGDRIERDQPVIEVETEKASLEVPATTAGVVRELLVGKGDSIRVGQTILRVEEGAAADEAGAASDEGATQDEPATEPGEADAASDEGPAGDEGPARDEPAPDTDEAASADEPAHSRPAAATERDGAVVAFPARGARPELGPTVPAAPSTRRLARELGVAIADVRGSGPGGRITRDDVKAHAKRLITSGGGSAGAAAPALPDFSEWGDVEREPLSNVRRATARAMSTAWATVPHVTQFDRADVTELEALRRRFNGRRSDEDGERPKLTMTALVVKTVAAALQRFPQFNASLDLEGEAVVFKKYVNVGVAVDTDRGLLVPVIRGVDDKGLLTVAADLNELAGRARGRKLTPDEMRGATFTVSNLGGLGTTYFSPIVNWPEVAILGVGRAERLAVFDEDDRMQPRLILPLSLSYDHRIIDGADAARFLRWTAEALEQPLMLLDA